MLRDCEGGKPEALIIATGSEPIMLPGLPDDPRIVDSTGALELAPLPKRMLVDVSEDQDRVLNGYIQGLSAGSEGIDIGDVPWSAWLKPAVRRCFW